MLVKSHKNDGAYSERVIPGPSSQSILDMRCRSPKELENLTTENHPTNRVQVLLVGYCRLEDKDLLLSPLFDYNRDTLLVLDIRVNQLRSIDGISGLSKLQELIAFSNQISSLPESLFERLYHLHYIDLSHNRLKMLPDSLFIFCPKLTRLDVSRNHISTIPVSIGSAANLMYLNISFNKLETIPTQFSQLSSLEFLDVSHNQIHTLPSDVFVEMCRVSRLLLHHNLLEHLPDLSDLLSLQILDVRGNRIRELPTSLLKLAHLSYLHIADSVEWKRYRTVKSCCSGGFLGIGSHSMNKNDSTTPSQLSEIGILSSPGLGNLSTLKFPPIEVCAHGIPAIIKFMKQQKTLSMKS